MDLTPILEMMASASVPPESSSGVGLKSCAERQRTRARHCLASHAPSAAPPRPRATPGRPEDTACRLRTSRPPPAGGGVSGRRSDTSSNAPPPQCRRTGRRAALACPRPRRSGAASRKSGGAVRVSGRREAAGPPRGTHMAVRREVEHQLAVQRAGGEARGRLRGHRLEGGQLQREGASHLGVRSEAHAAAEETRRTHEGGVEEGSVGLQGAGQEQLLQCAAPHARQHGTAQGAAVRARLPLVTPVNSATRRLRPGNASKANTSPAMAGREHSLPFDLQPFRHHAIESSRRRRRKSFTHPRRRAAPRAGWGGWPCNTARARPINFCNFSRHVALSGSRALARSLDGVR